MSDTSHTPIAFTSQDVEKLAALARLEVSDEQKEGFANDIGSILSYVGQIQDVAGSSADLLAERIKPDHYVHKNIMREDIADKGTGSELNDDASLLINSAPDHTEEHIKVKKILGSSQ